MKARHPLTWLIPLIILLLIIPFIVPSALPDASAAELDLSGVDMPVYEPVDLANTDPGEVPTETIDWGKKGATRERVLYKPHWKGFGLTEDGKKREYLDGTISVKVEERTIKNTKVFFTWIQVSDPSQIRTQFAYPYPSETEIDADILAVRENAVLTMTGDSCTGIRAGTVVRNGLEYRKVDATIYQQLIIDKAGDFHIIMNPTAADMDAWEGNILHSFIFGPALVIDGERQDLRQLKSYGSGITLRKKAQRNILCQMDKLSYLIITTEGPEQSKNGGFTLYEMSDLAFETGAQTAYNLDGGCTTWLVLGDERINNPSRRSARGITDIIYFVTAEEDPEPEPTPTPEPTETPELALEAEGADATDTPKPVPTATPEEIELNVDMEETP